MRLIDADKLREVVHGVADMLKVSLHEKTYSESDVIYMIDRQPTVEAETVRCGKWKVVQGVNAFLTCSECGYELVVSPQAMQDEHYCCNCGAKMECMETDDAEN